MVCSALVFHPLQTFGGTPVPGGHAGAIALASSASPRRSSGFFAATFGAAMETGLSSAYTSRKYFGWAWGSCAARARRPLPHRVIVSILVGMLVLLTTIDPIQLTEYTLVFSAVVLPLTYLPILVVANDRGYLGAAPTAGSPTRRRAVPADRRGRRGGRDPVDGIDPDGGRLTC
jgi:Mn2+/Fe2+ NRAMP family transporter